MYEHRAVDVERLTHAVLVHRSVSIRLMPEQKQQEQITAVRLLLLLLLLLLLCVNDLNASVFIRSVNV